MNILERTDESLFLILNGNHYAVLDYIMLIISNLLTFIPVFLICTYVFIKYLRGREDYHYPIINTALIIVVLAMQYFLCRYFLHDIFKEFSNRERPCSNPNISAFVRLLGGNCKPNNHSIFTYKTCLMFCLSSFLFFTIKEDFKVFKLVLILWALTVAYSRIYLGNHYPLNVLCSAATGIAAGYLIYKFYYYIKYNLLVI